MAYNDDERSLLRRKKRPLPKRTPQTTPAERQTLERRPLPDGRATPRDKQILPRELRAKAQKPARFNSTDSLNTSRYAGPFRKPQNLTDSLGTASKVAAKYRNPKYWKKGK